MDSSVIINHSLNYLTQNA